jgi:vancomycin permeability regulator SanA
VSVLLLAFAVPVAWVQVTGQTRVRSSTAAIEPVDAVLVLGAGLRPDGTPSAYLSRRLDVAAELYAAGVAPRVILSGDAHVTSDGAIYDEPGSMRDWILEKGVPSEALVLDRRGLDTTASCRRARDEYEATTAVVVTQDYHLRRALFSCNRAGLDAVGVGASAQSATPVRALWWHVREAPASWKAAVREIPPSWRELPQSLIDRVRELV